MVEGDRVSVDVHSVEKTGRVDDGLDVLEISLMVDVATKESRTFTAWVYSDRVELKSDPNDANLHPDELKDLMAGVAHQWEKQFGDLDMDILMRPEPVV
jgi:hypothetical protein